MVMRAPLMGAPTRTPRTPDAWSTQQGLGDPRLMVPPGYQPQMGQPSSMGQSLDLMQQYGRGATPPGSPERLGTTRPAIDRRQLMQALMGGR